MHHSSSFFLFLFIICEQKRSHPIELETDKAYTTISLYIDKILFVFTKKKNKTTKSKMFFSPVEREDLITMTADDWFAGGRRVRFDPQKKLIIKREEPGSLLVFERTFLPLGRNPNPDVRWLTMLPGFPDGSYGFAKVESLLERREMSTPRLYVEYVGQGDSEKPTKDYKYSTIERADLVEAQWRAHGIRRTVVVSFDYSSIVLLELLRRQQENPSFPTKIEHVLMMNGGYFADGHTHPWSTTPLLKTRIGKMGSVMAQRSNIVFDTMLRPLYSRSYRASQRKLMKREMRETEKAIRRHHGTTFLSNAAGFVDEHKRNNDRWDLKKIFVENLQPRGVSVHLVGSEEDRFEYHQIDLARERLKTFYPQVKTERISGGHLTTTEKAEEMTDLIEELTGKSSILFGDTRTGPVWADTRLPPAWANARVQPIWASPLVS